MCNTIAIEIKKNSLVILPSSVAHRIKWSVENGEYMFIRIFYHPVSQFTYIPITHYTNLFVRNCISSSQMFELAHKLVHKLYNLFVCVILDNFLGFFFLFCSGEEIAKHLFQCTHASGSYYEFPEMIMILGRSWRWSYWYWMIQNYHKTHAAMADWYRFHISHHHISFG